MTKSGALKIILFNLMIAILLIVLYHPNCIGLSMIDASTLEITCAITFLPFLLVALIFGNKKLMQSNSVVSEEDSRKKLKNELAQYKTNELFSKQVLLAIEHLDLFESRKNVLMNVLQNNFINDDNYSSFNELIDNAETSILNNCRIIANSVSTFNYIGYKNIVNYKNSYTEEVLQKKKAQYEEYFTEINSRVNQNANLLVEFDNLIMEVNRINHSDSKNELNDLIDMVSAMKQLHFSGNDDITNLTHKYDEK